MKVVLVGAGMIEIPPPDYGAVEKHIWNLAQALERRGHEVRIVNRVFGETSKDEYRFALWARREVRREPYDVLHLHTPGVATIFHALGPRAFVYTTHSRHWAGAESLGERIGHYLEQRAVDNAVETIAVSRFVAGQIDRPTHVIPNGVDVAQYVPLEPARTGKRIVGLGEIAMHKQWHVVAEVLAGLDATFEVAGPIRDLDYAKRIEDAGGRLMGPLGEEDLVQFLGTADILAHPSISESFGMAVVEGMSCGLPVICSDLLSFLVTPGVEGFLIPTEGGDPKRKAAMHENLERLLGDANLRHRMGQSARERAQQGFAWDSVAERVEAVYRRVAP